MLLALGFPLAVSLAAGQQQRVVVDRIDDSARFAALAQFVIDAEGSGSTGADERRDALRTELTRYQELYGIRVGIFLRDDNAMARSPGWWELPGPVRAAAPSMRRSPDGAATIRRRCGPGRRTANCSSPPRSSSTGTWSPSSPPNRPPT